MQPDLPPPEKNPKLSTHTVTISAEEYQLHTGDARIRKILNQEQLEEKEKEELRLIFGEDLNTNDSYSLLQYFCQSMPGFKDASPASPAPPAPPSPETSDLDEPSTSIVDLSAAVTSEDEDKSFISENSSSSDEFSYPDNSPSESPQPPKKKKRKISRKRTISKPKKESSEEATCRKEVRKIRDNGTIFTSIPKKRSSYPEMQDIKETKEVPFYDHLPEERQKDFVSVAVTERDRAFLKEVDKEAWTKAKTHSGFAFLKKDVLYGDFPSLRSDKREQPFSSRRDLLNHKINNAPMSGIYPSGKGYAACCIVANSSGGYDSKDTLLDSGVALSFVGQGGKIVYDAGIDDYICENQDLNYKGNNALFTSFVHRVPVRVVRGAKLCSKYRPKAYKNEIGYSYDGLYVVTAITSQKKLYSEGKSGLIYKFRLVQLDRSYKIKENNSPIPIMNKTRSSYQASALGVPHIKSNKRKRDASKKNATRVKRRKKQE